jgi:hypothetical protein
LNASGIARKSDSRQPQACRTSLNFPTSCPKKSGTERTEGHAFAKKENGGDHLDGPLAHGIHLQGIRAGKEKIMIG